MKKLNELTENSNTIHEKLQVQNDIFTDNIGIIKKEPEMRELKNSMSEMRNVKQSIWQSRASGTQTELEDRNREITQLEENGKKKPRKWVKKAYVIYGMSSKEQVLE